MTTFDERDKGFENKFAHDREMAFRIIAHRDRLLGLWAAEKLGKTGGATEAYAKEIVLAEIDGRMMDKLLKDFKEARVAMTEKDIRREMARLHPLAARDLMGEEA